ncbi:hypothetical protein FACS1894167_09950 [Synergistales bacterium]|nr:hypothetical protein FACS1894167_09950 [Synergistales bacterium]
MNCLSVSGDDGRVILSAPMRMGELFTAEYIHSVQLTPVVDEYAVLQGRIWGWRELTMSHNAGLPFAEPEHGRFVSDAPWMIIQGGRRAEERIAYRVGTSKFGRNVWLLPPFGEIWIHEKIPSRRVFIEASVKRSGSAAAINQTAEAAASDRHPFIR